MKLTLVDPELEAGDLFDLSFRLYNDSNHSDTWDVYVVLDVYGYYWFWPSWKDFNQGIDKQTVLMQSAGQRQESVLRFEWPAGVGSAQGLNFYGAVFYSGTFNLIGELQIIGWSYM